MIHTIVDDIVTDLKTLSFADRVGGIVYPLQRKHIDKDGRSVVKTIPIYQSTEIGCDNASYVDFVPNDDYKSCIYFESSAERAITDHTRLGQVATECTLTVVGWFNLRKINQGLTSAEAMFRNIVYKILQKSVVGDTDVVVELSNIDFRNPAIFNRYSYDEAEKQYLIYPYDFGSATFDVQLIYPICDEEPNDSPDCFNS
jgi:hypothetical protein